MEKEQEKTKLADDAVTRFAQSIKNLSSSAAQEEISLALKDRDVQFQSAIEDTKNHAEKIAREEVQKEVRSIKKDIFTLFGIFASFIAFIVGEINILKTIDSIYDKLGFSFIFVSLMLGFLFGMMFLMDEEGHEKKMAKMRNVFAVFFLIGMTFILMGKFEIVLYMIRIF